MGTYFKPLRRKFGLVTLLMACVLTSGWVKSYDAARVIDYFDPEFAFLSQGGNLSCGFGPGIILIDARSMNGQSRLGDSQFMDLDYVCPYWTLVIPLTLISAYLLLSNPAWLLLTKPRDSNQKKTVEPIASDGT